MDARRAGLHDDGARGAAGALANLAKSRFRARFQLGDKEASQVRRHGEAVIRSHARDLIVKRLAAAEPKRDGKQTPFRGHPVFVAQHATATCCRSCLEKWHRVPKGQAMSDNQIEAAVGLIMAWITLEMARQPEPGPSTPESEAFIDKPNEDPQLGLFD